MLGFPLVGYPESDGLNKKLQDKLKMSFQNLTITNVSQSPIDDLYEVYTGSRVLYYYPKSELLVFGEILNSSGISLTQQSLQAEFARRASEIKTGSALKITGISSPDTKEIIEFIDPNCSYCRDWNYLSKKYSPTRKVIFSVKGIDGNSAKKAIHIMCSEDSQTALDQVMFGMIMDEDLRDCEEGRKQLIKHSEIVGKFGVEVTPAFILVQNNNELVKGMQREKLMNYLRGK